MHSTPSGPYHLHGDHTMNTAILAPIARDNHIRDAQASSLAHEVFLTADSETIDHIVLYGKYLGAGIIPPTEIIKNFYRAVLPLSRYQEVTAPLAEFPARLDDFDHKFAVTLCRLIKTGI